MAELNHNHQIYDNYVLANEIEDQINSKLDLVRFCTVDNSLVGVAGDTKVIRVYHATDATEKLAMGEGNTLNIEVAYDDVDYTIQLAQNRFPYYDEELMRDPLAIQTGLRHGSTDMVNTMQDDIFAEFAKAEQSVETALFDFNAFVDAVALLPGENNEELEVFALVHKNDKAAVRKALKDDLKYVEAFVRGGYIGTVAGVNLYTSNLAQEGVILGGTKKAVTLFNKKGTEVEQERDANIRLNKIYSRKYYVAAMTDATQCFKIVKV